MSEPLKWVHHEAVWVPEFRMHTLESWECGHWRVIARRMWSRVSSQSFDRWVLYAGELELGSYATADEAKAEASAHLCYYCGAEAHPQGVVCTYAPYYVKENGKSGGC